MNYDWSSELDQNNDDIKYHRMRLAFVTGVGQSLNESGLSANNNFRARKFDTKGQKILEDTRKKMEKLKNESEERSKDLMLDLTGQVSEAFSKEEYFFKWGTHFCLSIKTAHLYQFCNNFKDPGVQHYCSELFSETRDRLDNIFVTLPAPKPSRPVTARSGGQRQPVNMARFMNNLGGCFLGSSLVHLKGQRMRRVDKIKKGDEVLTGQGTLDQVECVLKTVGDENKPVELVHVSESLMTTPWHPIKDEESQTWKFPADTGANKIQVYTDAVYTFLLKNRGTILIGDTECATLAHGIEGDVIGHEFLGTENVAADLKRFPTFDEGLVEVRPESFIRSQSDGKIVALSREK